MAEKRNFVGDLVGSVFGQIEVISLSGKDKHGKKIWLCRCSCGNFSLVGQSNFFKKTTPTRSCGCAQKAAMSLRTKTHGMSGTRIYNIWCNMRQRCLDPRHTAYHRYGGRGITVCDQWSDFKRFYADMGDPPSEAHSIDRKENDGHYNKENCRWATPLQQANNRRKPNAYGNTARSAITTS